MTTTSDEDALLASIEAAPFDDAPRLVYADWLQENRDDAKADYLRTVVRLLHPPEELAIVQRCLELSTGLAASWRQKVGGRFEVVLEGGGTLFDINYLINMVLALAFHEPLGKWTKGVPLPLRRSLTREDAETFVDKYRPLLLEMVHAGKVPLAFGVRPMSDESASELLKPI